MTKRIRRVALFLDGSRAFDRGLLRGIARYVGLHRPWVFLRPAAFYQRSSALTKQSAEELARLNLDGVIMNGSRLETTVIRLGIPVIVVPVRGIVPGARHLLSENREGAILAADHLVAQGLRQFAFVGFDKTLWSLDRRDHFCRRLAERGWTAAWRLVPLRPYETRRSRYEGAMVQWLQSLPKPVGLMAGNDELARWLSELCRLNGVRIPEEVSLIGADNDELICELSSPPLSSVAFGTERAGYEAAELLDSLMVGRRVKTDVIVARADRVVARQSTDLLTIQDQEVVKALRFIRRNSDRLIQVNDVVEATLLSHRTLHTRFCRAVGHSLVKEVNRQRAAHVARLLTTTNDSIHKIARSLGYENSGHLGRFFAREMGATPRDYRRHRQSSFAQD
jgi:LacI family transcriptional regulator